MTARPYPVADPDSAPFWAAAANGVLRLPYCCGRFHFPPGPRCPGCLEPVAEWRELSGRAFLYSWTTVHVLLVPGFDPPWTVAEVEPVEQPGLLIPGGFLGTVRSVGLPVHLTWTPSSDGATRIPMWVPDER